MYEERTASQREREGESYLEHNSGIIVSAQEGEESTPQKRKRANESSSDEHSEHMGWVPQNNISIHLLHEHSRKENLATAVTKKNTED